MNQYFTHYNYIIRYILGVEIDDGKRNKSSKRNTISLLALLLKIVPQNFKNIKAVLYLLLSRSDVGKLKSFPCTQVENGLLFNVKVIFEPKRSYYDSLFKVITQIPNFTIEKILLTPPRVLQLPTTHTRNISNVCEIEALTVNDEYRVRLLRDMLTGIKAEQIDAEVVIYQLNCYCRNWPKEWSTFKITDVCVVSSDRSQVGKVLYSIVSLILIYIYYTI